MKNNPASPNKKYTKEEIIKVFEDVFNKPEPENSDRMVDITDLVMGIRGKAYELSTLKDKVLDGYWYEFNTGESVLEGDRQINAKTGSGGAKEFIKIAFEAGMSEEMIGDSISVYTDSGKFTLNELKVNKNIV